ncbi:hypothetical protein BWQ96_00853 [Gracilariopsis chorda]|uniref:DUF2834 domain-containing protein n=1 Tax=Gracilariopsis chorda TaxID=448386 RepID=A0A2V3J4H4_9FLOR|nr:hypothetical protein BWQ96_00853 [Gracilariopsis chorda]|eukprot:PXF49279.1 hypothetical protein BWQ96_00853 [Gracilariopsis chorda]
MMCSRTDEMKTETSSTSTPSKSTSPVPSIRVERVATGVAAAVFAIYGLVLAPGSLTDLGEIGRILSGRLDEVNDLFFAIFNLLGAVSFNFAVLLNPGASRQKLLSTGLFSFLGVFFGFGALGPYLAAREYVPSVSSEEVAAQGITSRVLESRAFSVGLLVYVLWIYAFALGVFTPGTENLHDAIFYAAGVNLFRLFSTDRFASVSVVDLVCLSLATWGPLTEDMRRRGWFAEGRLSESYLTALSIASTPGLGVALYLIMRPRLPKVD